MKNKTARRSTWLPVLGLATALSLNTNFSLAAQPPTTLPTTTTVQVKRKPGDAEWKPYPARTLADLPGFSPSLTPKQIDKYGGTLEHRQKATGFFQVEKLSGRWWFIDPEGGLFIHKGVVAVNPRHGAAFSQRFKNDADWEKKTNILLRDNGFNGAGAWSNIPALTANSSDPLVYTIIGNIGLPGGGEIDGFMRAFGQKLGVLRPGVGHTDYVSDAIPVFHPDFPAFCDSFARPLASRKNDPYLLGYFSDNEMPLPQLTKYLGLSPTDPATRDSYRAARTWWDKRKGATNAPLSAITPDDQEAWAQYVFERYYAITTAAIRKYDPNHLCLGSRITGRTASSAGVLRAGGKYLDVVSVNLYYVWNPKERIAQMASWSGKPLLITEWYAKGMDSGFTNTTGAGWTVPTQKDRGLFYQTFTLGLLESKDCVGWHWFKYRDNDPNDKNAEASNRDSNKGIVQNSYESYPPLLEQMKLINQNVYDLADYFDRM